MVLSPYLMSLRFNLAQEAGDDLFTRHCTAWLAALAEHRAINCARIFQNDEATAAIETTERKIIPVVTGARQYLALIEFNQPFDDAGTPVADITKDIFPAGSGRRDEIENRLWLEIGYDSPQANS